MPAKGIKTTPFLQRVIIMPGMMLIVLLFSCLLIVYLVESCVDIQYIGGAGGKLKILEFFLPHDVMYQDTHGYDKSPEFKPSRNLRGWHGAKRRTADVVQ
jgi:hypothetical protein